MIPYSKTYTFTPWAYSINIDKDLDTFRFVASPVTDVREANQYKEKIVIYPNPSGDYIDISSINPTLKRGDDECSDIQIFDILGEIVLSVEQTSPSVQRIDISNLTPGIYFIKIGNRLEKFVKM